MSAATEETSTRQKWNLAPGLTETEKRKARRLLRAQLAKAKQTGEYPDSLRAAMTPGAAVSPATASGDEEDDDGDGEDEEAEKSDDSNKRRRGRTRKAVIAAASAAPVTIDLEAIAAGLREAGLTELPELHGGYIFSLRATTVGQIITKFTARMKYPPTQFSMSRNNCVILGPSNLATGGVNRPNG